METVLITALATVVSAALSATAAIIVGTKQHQKSTALMEYKLDEVIKKQDKHNKLIERTYELEKKAAVLETRVNDLEEK